MAVPRQLSIFINIDRTYLSIIEMKPKGISLECVEATRFPIDLEFIDNTDTQNGLAELKGIIDGVRADVDALTVTIPSESVFVSQFPGHIGMTQDQLKKLVDLEIRQAYPQFNPEEFASNIIPMEPDKKGTKMMLVAIMQRDIIETINKVFADYLPVSNVEISQLNAHTAFLYNYPELADKTVMIFGVQDQFIDVSLLKNAKPAYYNLLSFLNKDGFSELIEESFNLCIEKYVDKIDGMYFFGSGLTKDLHFAGWEMASLLETTTDRLNAFRMVTTDLDKRRRDYCSRMQHVFPPAIGAAIPPYHQRIRLY